jgi:hypothetical protein
MKRNTEGKEKNFVYLEMQSREFNGNRMNEERQKKLEREKNPQIALSPPF